jgi:hypothetical protein
LSKDITSILAGWDYEPDELQVRIVAGDDGRDKIQMRIDLGLIQMELTGRPDGRRAGDAESLLDALEAQARQAATTDASFALDTPTCAALMREGLQYYHRYLAAFHLQCYDLVVRDTDRNLRLFAFVVQHATRQRDKREFDRYRPYVIMMNTRARAAVALGRSDHATALRDIDAGIEKVRSFLRDYGESEQTAECFELGFLLQLRREVEDERPVGPTERLEQQLGLAVAVEDYEEAARIRDQIQRLRNAGVGRGG